MLPNGSKLIPPSGAKSTGICHDRKRSTIRLICSSLIIHPPLQRPILKPVEPGMHAVRCGHTGDAPKPAQRRRKGREMGVWSWGGLPDQRHHPNRPNDDHQRGNHRHGSQGADNKPAPHWPPPQRLRRGSLCRAAHTTTASAAIAPSAQTVARVSQNSVISWRPPFGVAFRALQPTPKPAAHAPEPAASAAQPAPAISPIRQVAAPYPPAAPR